MAQSYRLNSQNKFIYKKLNKTQQLVDQQNLEKVEHADVDDYDQALKTLNINLVNSNVIRQIDKYKDEKCKDTKKKEKTKEKKKDTIVKLNTTNSNTEIELLPFSRSSLMKYDDDHLMTILNRESFKTKRKKYFENLLRLMQNNLTIIFLFFLCALPVSFLF